MKDKYIDKLVDFKLTMFKMHKDKDISSKQEVSVEMILSELILLIDSLYREEE